MPSPNWVDITWISIASTVCLLGMINLAVWLRWRTQYRYLTFAILCLCIAACAVFEWRMFNASTPQEHAFFLRWASATLLPTVLGVAWLVIRLAPTRRWLVIAVVATRTVATIANFTTGDNVFYVSVTGLRPIETWGGVVLAGPVGTANPWLAFGQASSVLLVVLIVDAMLALRRQPPAPERTRNLLLLGGILSLVMLAAGWNIFASNVDPPLINAMSPAFLGLMLILMYELGSDVLRGSELARRLDHSESSLRDSQLGLLLAEREGRIGSWAWDLRDNAVELSPRALEILGVADGRAFQLTDLRERGHPDDIDALRTIRHRAMREGLREFSTELRLRLPDGRRRWIDLHGQVTNEGGEAASLRAVGLILDHTERRGLEEHFQLVFGSSPIAMLLVDEDGRIILANDEMYALSGHGRGELLGQPVETLVPLHLGAAHVVDRRAFQRGSVQRAMARGREVSLVRASGEAVPVDVALNPVAVDGHRYVIAAISDIRERRAQERELAQQRESLAHLSRIGMLSELSGSLAHELNQPLAAILANAEACLRFLDRPAPEFDEVRAGLEQIAASSRRAGQTIRGLRAMLRNESAQFVPVDLNGLVLEVLRILRGDLLQRHVAVSTGLQPGLAAVSGDAMQLQTVLLNLLMNAVESMGEVESPAITVSTRDGPDGVRLDVADIGCGIKPADLDRMFLPFVTTKASGLGLGLALCRSLVEAHGGRLWASNNHGTGATLHLWLPAAGSRAKATSPAAPARAVIDGPGRAS
jgi:PAS domain S-box-containing protein